MHQIIKHFLPKATTHIKYITPNKIILEGRAKNMGRICAFCGAPIPIESEQIYCSKCLNRMAMKMPVREIMISNVITAGGSTTALEGARKMVEHKIGSLVITKDDKPIGIVTERDMIQKVMSKDIAPSSVRLKDVMSQPLVTIKPDEGLSSVAQKMLKKNIRRLPVVKNDKLVGIITDADMISFASSVTDTLTKLMETNFKGHVHQLIREEKKRK
ncbi:MAG: CBS domain-containing protein [Methanosarcinales archaeon]|nr:MAG: CBS domain-containing protein [Methanosarcinales archaeon]